MPTSSNTSQSTNVDVQGTEITLTPAALQSIITAAIATAMSQSPIDRALFDNDNVSGISDGDIFTPPDALSLTNSALFVGDCDIAVTIAAVMILCNAAGVKVSCSLLHIHISR